MYFIAALLAAFIGVLPLAFGKRFGIAAIVGAIATLIMWWLFWGIAFSTVWPLFGVPGFWA
jgi:hypothetical protein